VPAAVTQDLHSGFGKDEMPDVLGVTMQGSPGDLDKQLHQVVTAAEQETHGDLTVAVTTTGDAVVPPGAERTTVSQVVGPVEDAAPGDVNIVQAASPEGLFIDQQALIKDGVSSNVAVQALLDEKDANGQPQMADAFAGFAVQFGRYCSTALAATG